MTMTTRPNAQQLAHHFDTFNQELITFVAQCSETDWHKVTLAEGWPVGVTARHIGVAHYLRVQWVQMIVDGQPLPAMTMEVVDQLNDQHAQEHANCTQPEVLELLSINGAKVLAYISRLNDGELERQDYLKLFNTTISARQLFEVMLITSSRSHLESIKATGSAPF